MLRPSYDLDEIRFSTQSITWEKAVGLYCNGKVKNFRIEYGGFVANILGTHLYHTSVSAKNHNQGECDCYMGQNDYLCKHMIALAICATKGGKPLTEKEKDQNNELIFSKKVGAPTKMEFEEMKRAVSHAMRCIKSYDGPSSTWFAYQDSLTEGCNRLRAIFSTIPASRQTTKFILKLLLKLDDKLSCGGVDDSDGAVGGFIDEAVGLLEEFIKASSDCKKELKILEGVETCFSWEASLIDLISL